MSVIIPAYAHAEYVVASVESVLSNASPPCEIIVVDDSSPDDTAQRLAPYIRNGRIRYVRQQNAGMAEARNHGARLAAGKYLYFLDDDDLVFPGALTRLTTELEKHSNAAMVFGDAVLFSGEAPYATDVITCNQDDALHTSTAVDRTPFMLFNQLGSPGQVLIRRSAFITVGSFDSSIWGTDDWDLWMRLLARHPARRVRRPVLAYRVHASNASGNVPRMLTSSLRVARKRVRDFPPEQQRILQRYTYQRLRRYHAPRLAQMFLSARARGQWRMAASAGWAWTLAWGAEASAYVALKGYLLRHGRWGIRPGEPLVPTIVEHCGRL